MSLAIDWYRRESGHSPHKREQPLRVEAVWKRETQSCRGIDSVLHRRSNSIGHKCWRNFNA
ncbi:hypothetical protein C0Z20_24335 [Trinickia symbiotica]|uniref:Uncharacterized protein n=1 Tax=Trinickia symbiotica TaxID=863227 RepID=A0A2N7WVB7_9BURK|nr:hypothetical protein C0Z20_24335 [Trinickia symbiotica]